MKRESQVLAVEPAEHQRRAQHHARNAAGQHELFLFALGAGVVVVGHRLHHRGADVHEVGQRGQPLHRVQHAPGRCDVVANEGLGREVADLRLQHDHRLRAVQVRFPVPAFGEIGFHDRDVGVQLPQHLQVRAVLVEHHQVAPALALQVRHEVLAHEAGAAGEDDLGLVLHG
jgi:hypothetical protein